MEIYVKNINNNVIILHVFKFCAIKNIKALINKYTGYIIIEKELMFENMLLENDKTLEYYNIKDKYTLHLILSMRHIFDRPDF